MVRWETISFAVLFTVMLKGVGGTADDSSTTPSHGSQTTLTDTRFPVHGEGFVVGLLSEGKKWIFTGSLITWTKVLTTCTAVLSREVKYASFGSEDKNHGWTRTIEHFETDPRCPNGSIISKYLRYNVGIFKLEEPAVASRMTRLLQYPSLSKQKYLRYTDQVINRRLNCSVTSATEEISVFNDSDWGVMKNDLWIQQSEKTGWREMKLNMMPTHEWDECTHFTGMHEFMCARSAIKTAETTNVNQGTPLVCGEDAYGVLVAPQEQHGDVKTAGTLIFMRLDEFVHLLVHQDLNFDEYS